MKFDVGSKVRLKDGLVVGQRYGGIVFTEKLKNNASRTPFLIIDSIDDKWYLIEDCSDHYADRVTDEMLEPWIDYRNTKIRIKSPEHSKYVQEKLFENGFEWLSSGCKIGHVNRKFLYIGACYFVRCEEDDEQSYLSHDYKEIFIEMDEDNNPIPPDNEIKLIQIDPRVDKKYELNYGFTAEVLHGACYEKLYDSSQLYIHTPISDSMCFSITKDLLETINKYIKVFGIELHEYASLNGKLELESAIIEENERHKTKINELKSKLHKLNK